MTAASSPWMPKQANAARGFGDNGAVDVNPLIAASKPAQPDPAGTTFSAPPVIVNGVIVIGHINNMKNQYPDAPAGMIRAFDAHNGDIALGI